MASPVRNTYNTELETTDNTVTKVFSFTTPINGVYTLTVDIGAFNSTDGTAYVQLTHRSFKRVSGTVSALAASANIYAYGDATITVTISNSGDELYVEVTGVTAKTIDWNIITTLRYT